MFAKLYIVALPIFVVLDMIWFAFVAKNLFYKQIGFIMRPEINWMAAILVYLLLIAGLVLFVIMPAIEKRSWQHALLYGALFGLVIYATYDLTNMAVLKDWPMLLSLVDMSWGTILTALVSTASYFIAVAIL
jgi:uncharacterized membrane protein